MQDVIPFLWFDGNAEEAVDFYVSVFKNAKVGRVTRYTETVSETAGLPAGSVLTVSFELNGREFVALNGGPLLSSPRQFPSPCPATRKRSSTTIGRS